LRLLAFRRRTAEEVRKGLDKKGFSPAEIKEVIRRLEDEKLLDDAAFAQDFAYAKVPTKLWGRERVRNELLNRGISIEDIAPAILQVYSDYPEEDLALRAARAKWKSTLGRGSLRARQRVGSYLQRQGFPFEMIIRTLDCLKD
jgi:regulatory protein